MAGIENRAMDADREPLVSDVGELVDKYRSNFGLNVPDNDQAFSDRLILSEIRRQALDTFDAKLLKKLQP